MSSEISEEELTEKIITICGELEDIGERTLSKELFKKIEKKITFVQLQDWANQQICSTFPKCDLRTMVYCCAPTNPCPYRAAVLRKLGLTLKDYINIKEDLSRDLDAILCSYGLGKGKAKGEAWRKKAFEKLGTRSLGDIQKPDRSNVLRGVLGRHQK